MIIETIAYRVGVQLYWNIFGLVVNGQVLLGSWIVIGVIILLSFLSTLPLSDLVTEVSFVYQEKVWETFVEGDVSREAWVIDVLSPKSKREVLVPTQEGWIRFLPTVVKRRLNLLGVGFYKGCRGLRLIAEDIVEYLVRLAEGQLGDECVVFIPLVGTIFVFVFVSNWLAVVVPWEILCIDGVPLASPTSDINVTAALALITLVSYYYAGCSARGIGFFARYLSPSPVFLPVNVLEDFSRPLSLSVRLFGNALSDEVVVSVILLLLPLFVPLPFMFLGLFSGSVQAIVFALLAAAYVGESLRE
jgi:F-type H+-transporting ATPase subunit a